MRTPYVSPYPIVAAADFANCCKHIGDRVELIGRVVRVANATEPRSAARCLRVEFGAQLHDMTCLKVWPGSHSNRDATPDETWVGKWVSAVGLVEPVAQGPEAAQRQKHISHLDHRTFPAAETDGGRSALSVAFADGARNCDAGWNRQRPDRSGRSGARDAPEACSHEAGAAVEHATSSRSGRSSRQPATVAAPPKVRRRQPAPSAAAKSSPRRRSPARSIPEGAVPAEGAASARPEAGGLGRTRRPGRTARLPAVHAGRRSTVGGTDDRIRGQSPGCARGGAEAGGQAARDRSRGREQAGVQPAPEDDRPELRNGRRETGDLARPWTTSASASCG